MNRNTHRYSRGKVVALSFWLFASVVVASPGMSVAGQALAPQTNREGGVTVKVTPLDTAAQSASFRFEVVLDTHAGDLNHDMLAVTVLTDGGREWRPIAWEGDGPGGHHRKGILTFDPIRPAPASVTLRIRQVGGATERSFTWPVAAP